MKRSTCFFRCFGLFVVFLLGMTALDAYAEKQCLDPGSPLRGTWSYSQVSEVVPNFANLPDTSVGVFTVDRCGRLQGRAFANIPCQDQDCFGLGAFGISNPFAYTLEGQLITQSDGTATATVTAFGTEFHRVCVLMERQGECFQEFRCVSSDPAPPNAVLLTTLKRQFF